jgi:hypothetical protein
MSELNPNGSLAKFILDLQQAFISNGIKPKVAFDYAATVIAKMVAENSKAAQDAPISIEDLFKKSKGE